MPVRKKNKRNSEKKRKKDKDVSGINNNSCVPKPIKMNYYHWSLNRMDKSLKEQLALYRTLGKEAVENFPEKYKEIKKWFEKYGQTKILSFALCTSSN